MHTPEIRIGTRGSALARAQAGVVADAIRSRFTGVICTTVIIKTTGDRVLDSPLSRIGEKGLFTRELEEALLRGDIDIAVHSLKDLPTLLPEGLEIGAFLEREDPRDVLVHSGGRGLNELKPGEKIGTSSLRRRAQLLHLNPALEVVDVRGNVETRLRKMEQGLCSGLILAAAGLLRLGFARRITEYLQPDVMLPAVCQGIIGVESRQNDARFAPILQAINHPSTETAARAERMFLAELQGGCQVPLGCHTWTRNGQFHVRVFVADLEGKRYLETTRSGTLAQSAETGRTAAAWLLENGAREILEELRPAENGGAGFPGRRSAGRAGEPHSTNTGNSSGRGTSGEAGGS